MDLKNFSDKINKLSKKSTKIASKLGEKSSEVANTLSKKSEEMVTITKLKMKINKLQGNIERKKEELGEVVYSSYINNVDDKNKVTLICEEIKEIENEIQKINKNIEAITPGPKTCPNCGAKISDKVNFCSQCGKRITFQTSLSSTEVHNNCLLTQEDIEE